MHSHAFFPHSAAVKQDPSSVDFETTGDPPNPTPAAVAYNLPSALLCAIHSCSSSTNVSLVWTHAFELVGVMHYHTSVLHFEVHVIMVFFGLGPFSLSGCSFGHYSLTTVSKDEHG